MKVKIRDLKPNPYRDMKHYPVDSSKIETLIASIKQTGFWDNILGRKSNDKVEIAYGHHRLIALQKIFKEDDFVDIPIKPLSDANMLKIMANENMDEWKTNPAVIDETVKAAKKFLEGHPEEMKKVSPTGPTPGKSGFRTIAKFLGWKEFKVKYSLERLGMIGEGKIEPEAIKILPTERSARDFVKAVKQFKPTPEQQKKAAEKISGMAKGDRGEAAVRSVITEQIYKKPKAKHKDLKLIELREEIKATEKLARDFNSKLLTLIKFREEMQDQIYQQEIKSLAIEFNVMFQRLKTFLGGKNNVKQLKG